MFNRYDCNCCGNVRNHPTARWSRCLGFKRPSCPPLGIPKTGVMSRTPSHESKYVRNAKLVKQATQANNSSTKWKKVNWKRFQLVRQTKQFQTRIINTTTNNDYGLIIRNGRMINVAPTYERPCGYYTTDKTEANIPDTVVSNCCPNRNSDLTGVEIAAMPLTEVEDRLGIDRAANATCKSSRNESNQIIDIQKLPVRGCTRVPPWEPAVC